ncbi:MAG: aminotransferase class IV [Bacteroidota bacterium]
MKCIFNGQLKDQSEVSLPIHDIAVVRGYGIFDFFRLSQGVPLFIDDHLDRFYGGAERARLIPPINKHAFKEQILEMIEENDMPISGIRIILTGGVGNGPYAVGTPNLIVTQEPISFPTEEMFEKGVKLITHEYLRDIPEVKTINYMTGIWLQQMIQEKEAFDVLYVHKGIVHELTRSNIFIVNENRELITPNGQILKGITRKQLIRTLGNVQERDITVEELASAKEAFITGTTKKVLPIRAIDDWEYRSTESGSVTREIMKVFAGIEREYVERNKVKG